MILSSCLSQNKYTYKHAIVNSVSQKHQETIQVAVCAEIWEACNHWHTAAKEEAMGNYR